MQPHEKSVNLLVDCLFTIVGSGKPFHPNKHEQFTPEDVNLRKLILGEIYQTSNERE
jgi:hypothetical protein